MYVGTAIAWTIPATPTDMVELKGSDSTKVRLVGVIIDGLQTTAGINKFFLIKRSTPDTGGTPVADTIVPYSSKYEAAKAVFRHYTANPTLGDLVGNLKVNNLLCPAAASLMIADKLIWLFNILNAEQLILNNANESIVLNFNGVALPAGLSLNVTFIWSEG